MIHSTSNPRDPMINKAEDGVKAMETQQIEESWLALEMDKGLHDNEDEDEEGVGGIASAQDNMTSTIILTPHLIQGYLSALLRGMVVGFICTWTLTISFGPLFQSQKNLFMSDASGQTYNFGFYNFWLSLFETFLLFMLFLGFTIMYRKKYAAKTRGSRHHYVGIVFLLGAWVCWIDHM
jgi:hypothetical protein